MFIKRGTDCKSALSGVKLAKILDTTVVYLLDENKNAELLKAPTMLKRLQDIDNLPVVNKNGMLYALDNLLKAAKLNPCIQKNYLTKQCKVAFIFIYCLFAYSYSARTASPRYRVIDNLPEVNKNGMLYALDNLLKATKLKPL